VLEQGLGQQPEVDRGEEDPGALVRRSEHWLGDEAVEPLEESRRLSLDLAPAVALREVRERAQSLGGDAGQVGAGVERVVEEVRRREDSHRAMLRRERIEAARALDPLSPRRQAWTHSQ
jgi:hypothetical protein